MYNYITDFKYLPKPNENTNVIELGDYFENGILEPFLTKWKLECYRRGSMRPTILMNNKPSSLYEVALFHGNTLIPNTLIRMTVCESPRAYTFIKLYADLDEPCLRLPDHDNHPKTTIEANKHFFVHMSWILYCMQNKSIQNIFETNIDSWPYGMNVIHDNIQKITALLSNKSIIIYRLICRNYSLFNVFVNNFIISSLKYCRIYQEKNGMELLISKKFCEALEGHTVSLFIALGELFGKYIIPWLKITEKSKKKLHNLHRKCYIEFTKIYFNTSSTDDVCFGLYWLCENNDYNKKYSKTKKDIICGNYLCKRINTNCNFKICSRCNTVFYCNRKCQKYDWNVFNHKIQCDMVQDLILQNALDML